MNEKGWQFYNDCSYEIIQELKTKDHGVLFLREDKYRGIDTKFKSDALVAIGCKVCSIA